MLGWIIHTKRPLRKIELQSAITFSSGNPLQEEVVPMFVLSLCSQLVEERTDSTLALIHSSVKEYVSNLWGKPRSTDQQNSYLQSPDALVRVSEKHALMEHAAASMACLLSATRWFNSGKIDERRQQQLVLSGLHAFQLYAQEHWVDYVLAMGSHQSTAPVGNHLQELMGDLCSELEEIHQRETGNPFGVQDNNLSPDDRSLRCIQHLPMLHWAGAAILRARSLGPRAKGGTIISSPSKVASSG